MKFQKSGIIYVSTLLCGGLEEDKEKAGLDGVEKVGVRRAAAEKEWTLQRVCV